MSARVRARSSTVGARLRAVGGLRSVALLWCGSCLAAVCGCSNHHTGGSSEASPVALPSVVPPPVAPPAVAQQPPTLPDMSRRIMLQVTIDGVTYEATGLLIGDGTLRLSIGDGLGGLALLQLVGDVVQTNGYIAGGGTIYGEACASAPLARFCDRPSPVAFELPTTDEAKGAMWVTTAGSQETWTWTWQTYSWSPLAALPPAPSWDAVKGLYSIRGNELAGNAGTVLTIDGQGRLFFQSSETGCTGNGTMALRPNLDADLYDVSLTIEACVGAYAYLNNRFEGLSILDNDSACSGCWDDGVGLLNTPRLWLSMPAGAAALSFSADPVD
jgi:hypothetical protein